MKRRQAIIYLHEEHEGPGLLRPALEAVGFACVERLRQVEPEDAQADLLVSMGGPMGVYEATRFPFLLAELQVLRARVAANRPVLGVCLGAQLLASALGSKVYPGGAGTELGVAPVRWTPQGRSDPALAGLPATLEVAHWHSDTFDPVFGGTALASSDLYAQQAFRYQRSYGFQFHLELEASTFARWVEAVPAEVRRSGKVPADLVRDDLPRLKLAEPDLRKLCGQLAQAFTQQG